MCSGAAEEQFEAEHRHENILNRVFPREQLLAEMGVSIKEDGGTLGVFSPKGVSLFPISITSCLKPSEMLFFSNRCKCKCCNVL